MLKIISVTVKPNSKNEGYEIFPDGTVKLNIKERPVQNAANEAVIEKISKIYGVPKSSVKIKSGLKSKNKLVSIFTS